MNKYRSIMLALVLNVSAPEALETTEAPPLPTSHQQIQLHLVPTKDIGSTALLRQINHNLHVRDLKTFLVLKVTPTLSRTVI